MSVPRFRGVPTTMKFLPLPIRRLALPVAALALASAGLAVQAQTYPARPVTLVVPYPPGGTADILARSVGQKLGERLG